MTHWSRRMLRLALFSFSVCCDFARNYVPGERRNRRSTLFSSPPLLYKTLFRRIGQWEDMQTVLVFKCVATIPVRLKSETNLSWNGHSKHEIGAPVCVGVPLSRHHEVFLLSKRFANVPGGEVAIARHVTKLKLLHQIYTLRKVPLTLSKNVVKKWATACKWLLHIRVLLIDQSQC